MFTIVRTLALMVLAISFLTSAASAVTLNLTYNSGLSNSSTIVLTDPSGAYRIDITVSGGAISISGNSVSTSFFDPSSATPTVNFSANFPMTEITFSDMDNIDPNASRDSFAANVPGIWKNFGNSTPSETRTLSQFPLGSPPALGGGISFNDLIARGAQSPVILNANLSTTLEDNFFVTFQPTTPTNNFSILVDDTEGEDNIVSTYRFAATSVVVALVHVTKTVDQSNITAPGPLTYTISAQNQGQIGLTNPTFSDTLIQGATGLTLTSGPTYVSGDSNSNGVLNVGETWNYTATYNVPQSVIDNGANIVNTFTFDTDQSDPQSDVATTTITATPTLSITKVADDDTLRAAGETITYTYVVTNTGNVTINNISVSDIHNGSGTPPIPGNEAINANLTGQSTDATSNDGVWSVLRPGDSVRFTSQYTVTQNDVDTLQ